MSQAQSLDRSFAAPVLLHALAKNWWLLLLRGIAAIAFGVLALAWPGLTLLTLILLYGAYALADGVLSIIAAITGSAPAGRWWLAIVGLVGIAVGALTFMLPGMTALILLLTMGPFKFLTATNLIQNVQYLPRPPKAVPASPQLLALNTVSKRMSLV